MPPASAVSRWSIGIMWSTKSREAADKGRSMAEAFLRTVRAKRNFRGSFVDGHSGLSGQISSSMRQTKSGPSFITDIHSVGDCKEPPIAGHERPGHRFQLKTFAPVFLVAVLVALAFNQLRPRPRDGLRFKRLSPLAYEFDGRSRDSIVHGQVFVHWSRSNGSWLFIDSASKRTSRIIADLLSSPSFEPFDNSGRLDLNLKLTLDDGGGVEAAVTPVRRLENGRQIAAYGSTRFYSRRPGEAFRLTGW